MPDGKLRGCLSKLGGFALASIVGLTITFLWNKVADRKLVPDVRGMTDMAASDVLIRAGFRNLNHQQVPGGIEGVVANEIPNPGSVMKSDSPIILYIQAGQPNPLVASNKGESPPQLKILLLPAGTPILVRMNSGLLVQHQTAAPSFEAELDAPLVASNGVVAVKGSRISLDVSSSVDSVNTSIRLSVRECKQIDDRSLYLSSDYKDFHSPVTWGGLIVIVVVCTAFGAVFSGVLTLGLDLGISGGTLGFFVGLLIALIVVTTQNKVEVPAGARLQFALRDSVQVQMPSNRMRP